MNKKYFTALLPASNIEMELKRIQQRSSLYISLPPIVPLEFYDTLIEKNSFNKNINVIEEFKIGELKRIEDWWVFELPSCPFKSVFNLPETKLLPSGGFYALLGTGEDSPENSGLPGSIIRNWELAFYELTIWDDKNPLDNIELKEIWKIRKKKLRTTKPQL